MGMTDAGPRFIGRMGTLDLLGDAGAGVIAVLVMGLVTPNAILMSAGIGAVLALPVSYFVAGRILALTSK